jgi:hypothetical protein
MNISVLDPVSFSKIQGLTHVLTREAKTATETGITSKRTLLFAREDPLHSVFLRTSNLAEKLRLGLHM